MTFPLIPSASLEFKLKNQQIDDQQASSLAGSLITTTALQKLK
jgi:hypothetical protein